MSKAKNAADVLFGESYVSSAGVTHDFYKTSGVRSDLDKFEPSLTRQEFAEECDINTLMQRYEATGVISHVNRAEPRYLDVTEIPDLRGAMDYMREASLSFNSLPANVRREFDNDPAQFVDFAQDPKNIDKMREWGFAKPVEAPPAPVKVEVIPPPEAPLAPAGPKKGE